jgi:hypothetical protein
MLSECALCGNEAELRDSHIIPRFVFKQLKESSASPFLREYEDPDERIQDYNEELLCPDCEEHLNKFESPVAGYIYHPYQRGNSISFSHDDWLHRFHISVNWRLIHSDLSEWENLPKHQREAVKDARDVWHDIILNDEPVHKDPFTHHMVLFSDLELRTDSTELTYRWEFYQDRAIDATVVHGAGTHYYVKLPKVVFITCIQPPRIGRFNNTKIEESGRIRTPRRIPRDIENFLVQRGTLVLERTASEQSQEKILERMLENPEQTLESDSFRAYAESMKRRIENHNPLDYLDQECEVCFTDHRVIKSLPERPVEKVELEEWSERQDEWNGRFVYFEPIYFEDELTHEDMSETATVTLVFGTEDNVVQAALYDDAGWVVEKEIDMTDGGDPVEMAKLLREETRSGYVEFVNQQQ